MQAHEHTPDATRPAAVRSGEKQQGDGHPLLGLQRGAGNAVVNRLIVQRDDDDEVSAGTGEVDSSGHGDASPMGFDPDAILSDMASGALSRGGQTAPSDDADVEVQAQRITGVAVQRDPPTGTEPSTSTRPAGAADLAKALAAWGPFKQALDAFKAEVEKSVTQTTSGNATPRSVAFTIAGLGAAVATAQPIPIKPYLSITLDPIGKQGVVTLDIGKLARIPGFDGGAPAPTSGPPGDAFGPGRF